MRFGGLSLAGPVRDNRYSYVSQRDIAFLPYIFSLSHHKILGFSHLKGPDGRTMPFCLGPLPHFVRQPQESEIISLQLRSHTCFHKLEIPMVDEETLERVMIATIESDNGCFGFDEE